MLLQAEHLPPEIWLYIFSFFEGHDLIRAFSYLNSFFDSLLRSPHLQLHIRIKKNESNQRLPEPIWSHINLQNIYSLSVGQKKANCLIQFLRWHAQYLIRLRTVSVYLRQSNIYYNIQFLTFALQQLPSLIFIRIKYRAKLDTSVNNMEPLMTYIFSSKYTIQKCSFISDMSEYNVVTTNWSINPLLKYLNINHISWINLFSLLSFARQLHSLHATLDASLVTPNKNLVLTHLKNANLHLYCSRFCQLEMFKEVAPNLHSLRLEGYLSVGDDDYFNENLWYKLFNNIKYYHVELKEVEFSDSKKIILRNRIRDYNGKSWFSWNELTHRLEVNIKYQSATI